MLTSVVSKVYLTIHSQFANIVANHSRSESIDIIVVISPVVYLLLTADDKFSDFLNTIAIVAERILNANKVTW